MLTNCYIAKINKTTTMTKEEQEEIMELLRGRDASEVLNALMHTGNRYSRRTLRFSDGSASGCQ